MRERMDFSSISGIIRENMGIDGLSDEELFYTLFFYAFEQEKYQIPMPGISDISRYLNGQRGITKAMLQLYKEDDNVLYLKQGVSKVLESVTDKACMIEQLTNLLQGDRTISSLKRKKLSDYSNDAEAFIAECLMFGMSRKSIPKGTDGIRKKDFLLSDYLLDNHVPSVGKVFVGRDAELDEINKRLNKEFCLFLEGIGGIGKSELAKQYAKKYMQDYENIIYLRYSSSLQKTIAKMNFVDDTNDMSEEDLFREHLHLFRLLDNDTLVILDNFDTVPEEEVLFHDFLNMNFRLLVTTRSHIEDIAVYKVNEIKEAGYLLELFYAYAPGAKEKESIVIEIIEEVYHHTLTVEMAAKTMTVSCLEPEELLSALRTEGIRLSNPNKVKVTKDSETTKERLYCHIQTLFRLQELSSVNLDTLRYMALMPETGISRSVFHQWQNSRNYNSVNDLVEFGWIQMDSEADRIYLHPMIHEVVRQFEVPSFTNCAKILQGIFMDCFCYGLDLTYYRDVLNTIESIYQNIRVDDQKSSYLFLCSTMDYLSKYGNHNAIERVLDVMEQKIPMGNQNRHATALYYCYRGGLSLVKNETEGAVRFYDYGILYLEPVNRENAALASSLYCNLGSSYMQMGKRKEGRRYIKKAIRVRERYLLPFSQNALALEIQYAQLLAADGKVREADSRISELIQLMESLHCPVESSLGELYFVRGMVRLCSYSLGNARDDFSKAERYLKDSLPPEHISLKQVQSFLNSGNLQIAEQIHT